MRLYLHTKFQVSSIILASFRQGGGGNFAPPHFRAPKNPIQIRVKKTYVNNMFVLKTNVKWFSSIYSFHNKVFACDGTANCRWNCFLLYLENNLLYWLQMWQYTIKRSNQQNSTYNHDHDILRLLENFPLTRSETKREY